MTKNTSSKISKTVFSILFLLTSMLLAGSFVQVAYAGTVCGGGQYTDSVGKTHDNPTVTTSIDLGCAHKGNPIMDLLFAIIRLLSAGVGLVVVGSIVVAGIQYSASRDDPQATAKARGRITTSLGALLIYIFAYAILNYVIPGQFFK